jgi:hypothetical protein
MKRAYFLPSHLKMMAEMSPPSFYHTQALRPNGFESKAFPSLPHLAHPNCLLFCVGFRENSSAAEVPQP